MADCRERVWVAARPKFESKAGKNMQVKKDLYGLKICGAAFRTFLEEILDAMCYIPSYADPDLRLRLAVKTDGFEYYKYILFYVDDVVCISHNLQKAMKRIHEYFKLKDNNIEPTDVDFGASLAKIKLESGKYC